MNHQDEPCASLPKTHLTVDLAYCHHHQAWTLTTMRYVEDGTITPDDGHYTVVRFGPFDSAVDVAVEAGERLQDAMEALLPL